MDYLKTLCFIKTKYHNVKIIPINDNNNIGEIHNIMTHDIRGKIINNTITFIFKLLKKNGENFVFAHICILNNENNVFDGEEIIGKNMSNKHGAYFALLNGLEKILNLNIIINNIIIKTPHYDIIKEIQTKNIKKIDPKLSVCYLTIKRILRNINDIKFEKI
jgi:hypothetical protein